MFKSKSLIEIRPILNNNRASTSKSLNESSYLPKINTNNDQSISNSNNNSKSTLELIRHSLEVREKINKIEKDKRHVKFDESEFKTINRPKDPIFSKTMNIDKWLDVHRRRNKQAALKIITKDLETSEALEILNRYNICDKRLIDNLIDVNDKKNLKAISIRQLRNLTLLDKVQERLRVELEQTLKKVRKLETQQEFNSIVGKIRLFIDEMEDFKTKNLLYINTDGNVGSNKSKLQLYEYHPDLDN